MLEHRKKCKDWQEKAYRCAKGTTWEHSWFPIASVKSESAEHVTMIMCGKCFHSINISDVHTYGEANQP